MTEGLLVLCICFKVSSLVSIGETVQGYCDKYNSKAFLLFLIVS